MRRVFFQDPGEEPDGLRRELQTIRHARSLEAKIVARGGRVGDLDQPLEQLLQLVMLACLTVQLTKREARDGVRRLIVEELVVELDRS